MRRPANWDANDAMHRIATLDVGRDPLWVIEQHGSLDDLDRAFIPEWISQLRETEANVRRLRRRLETLGVERACPVCGEPAVGRADRLYCSGACRVRAHRAGV